MSAREAQVRKDSRLFSQLCTALLERGHGVQFRAHGKSMSPNLLHGEQVLVQAVPTAELRRGDIALTQNLEGLRVHRVAQSFSQQLLTHSDTAWEHDAPPIQIFGKVIAHGHSSAQLKRLTAAHTLMLHPAKALLRRISLAAKNRFRRAAAFIFGAAALLFFSLFFSASAYAQADLTMTQVPSVTAVATGTNYTYTEVVTNNGPNNVPAGTLVVYQQTPPNTVFKAIAATNWDCTNNPGNNNTGPIICTYQLALNSGTSAPAITLTERVVAGTAAGTTIQNSATVTSATVDPVPTNNTTQTTIVVEPTTSSDLGISLSVAPSPVFVYSSINYTVIVQNLGQQTLAPTANVVQITLANGLTAISVTPPANWTCAITVPVKCSLNGPGTLVMGATATFTITATAPSTAQTLTTSAAILLATDPNTNNNNASVMTVVQPLVCATPGKDGAGGTLAGIVNAYYPPAAAETVAAGATSVAIGAVNAGGAQTPIAVGDLLLIIQMQAATINSTNTSSYGDGNPGDPATGSTSLGGSGNFEFVTATNAIAITGGTLQFIGSGPTGGLLNTYVSSAATLTQPQQTFQVIRVPQYTSATLSSTLAPLAWTGFVGGVLAIDVSSQLTLGGTVSADALGFRGGAGRKLGGDGAATTHLDTDYVTATTTNLNGSKGEGIAGTPRYIAPFNITTASTPIDTTGGAPADTLPGGSYARGAPGNAGAGGTDGDPVGNSENSGGGAGGNGGTGGVGGYGWNTFTVLHSTNGGFGGAAFPISTSALVLGGGGGAGTSNDGTYYISNASNGNGNGIFSSGGAGGGLIIIHAGSITGTGTITANGQTTLNTLNDSTGGGGAGGSIEVFSNSGPLATLTLSANGGNAGNAWPTQAPGAFAGQRHGPGGGGGGGVLFTSGTTTGTLSVAGGNNGYTNTAQDSYGATPGQAGVSVNTHIITETPGTQAGAYCASADLSVTNVASTPVVAPGGTISYTQVATNNGTSDAVNAVFTEALPANTVLASVFTPPAGWNCPTVPAVGFGGNLVCNNPSFASGANSTFNVSVTVGAGTPQGTQIVSVDNITSGTSDPNLNNNSATAVTTVSTAGSADLFVTNTPAASVVNTGSTVTVTAVEKNQGPAVVTNPDFTETVPAGTTFASLATPGGWICFKPAVGSTGTVIHCTGPATFAVAASVTFNVVLNVTGASGTQVSAIADVGSTTVDSNPSNNEAVAVFNIASPGQTDLAVSASGTPAIVSVNNNISYTQSVTNNGPAVETNATFTDTIPAGTTLVSFTPPANWTCNAIAAGGTGTFTCTLNGGQNIAVGASVNFPLVVKVAASNVPGSTITNSPTVSSTVGDPVASNNSATVKTIVASPTQADVSITKTASPEPVNVGTTLTYTLTITNSGPAVAQGVTVSDILPAQVSETSVSASQGSCSYAAPTISCNLGNISVGAQVVVNIFVTANSFSSGTLSTNTATVSSTTSDPNAANNTSSSVSTIQAATSVGLSSLRAFRQADNSMLLEWRTHEESRNLGFHIYREDSTGRHRINPSLIAGSALLLRGARPQHAAKTYHWIDPEAPPNASYTIEDVDLNGARVSHGPAYPEASPNPDLASAKIAYAHQSPLLNHLHNNVVAAGPIRDAVRLQTPRPAAPQITSGISPISLADHAAVKISVEQEGWYRITFAQLFAAGLNPETDTRNLHLFAEGIEQPMLVSRDAGEASPSDTIEFYGTGIDTPFSAARIYWLVRENHSGRRILPVLSASSGGDAPSSFPFTVVREDRTLYIAALLNGENNDNFFGAAVTSEPVDQDLVLAHVDKSSSLPVTLDVTLQGATDQQEHSVAVQVNGASVGTMVFNGQILAAQTFSVELSSLLEGSNTITLTALNGDNDISVVKSLQLHYPHTYAADGNWLRATAPSGTEMQVKGFSSHNIRVFDISDPLNITEISAKTAPESGTFAASFVLSHAAPSQRTLLVFSDDAVSAPVSIAYHAPSSLDDRHRGADIVMITHPLFSSSLAPLVELRESQGHNVSTVTVDEIFDEYNFGERSPFAIRSFLADAVSHWHRKPESILLVGDASLDPRDYLGLGDSDFVPTRMIETAAFKTSSDDWFSDFQQTGFATIPTGRLPVSTVAEADLVVAKIVNYERNRFAGAWNSQAVFIADQNIDANFSLATSAAANSLPAFLQVSQILANDLDPTTARSKILAALNNGSLLVNYSGHGSEQQWSFSDFFNTTDATALNNGGRLPVYIVMNCLNGFFQDVYADSLAESLLLAPNGGAVAVWASSGFTDQAPQATMNQALLHYFATTPNASLGRLILEAKSGTTDKDVRRSWILFGDPAMKLQMPFASTASQTPALGNPAQRQVPVVPKCQSVNPCSQEKETK